VRSRACSKSPPPDGRGVCVVSIFMFCHRPTFCEELRRMLQIWTRTQIFSRSRFMLANEFYFITHSKVFRSHREPQYPFEIAIVLALSPTLFAVVASLSYFVMWSATSNFSNREVLQFFFKCSIKWLIQCVILESFKNLPERVHSMYFNDPFNLKQFFKWILPNHHSSAVLV
jgi:hypothetical protein